MAGASPRPMFFLIYKSFGLVMLSLLTSLDMDGLGFGLDIIIFVFMFVFKKVFVLGLIFMWIAILVCLFYSLGIKVSTPAFVIHILTKKK